jgi:hypothetical protein
MHISTIFANNDPDHDLMRDLVRYAQEELKFTSGIGHDTDVTQLAKEHAEYAADALEMPHDHPVVGRATEELLRLGQDHQQDLPSQMYGDAQEEREASYGEWRNQQRAELADMERDR